MPSRSGITEKSDSNASTPPAEAPIPTMVGRVLELIAARSSSVNAGVFESSVVACLRIPLCDFMLFRFPSGGQEDVWGWRVARRGCFGWEVMLFQFNSIVEFDEIYNRTFHFFAAHVGH